MSEVEKFITDLNDLVTSVKEQKQENEELKTSLNEQLREYGKRIAELESGLCQIHDSSNLETIKEIVNSLIKDEIAKRNLVNTDVHEFFYNRVEELGIRPDFLRDKLKDGNTFVVGRIVLESVLCQKFEASLPITLYTCDDNVIAGFSPEYHCPQETGELCYNFSHNGVSYFRIYRHKNMIEMLESVDNDLDFCRNYFDGKNFIVRDTKSVVNKCHTACQEGMFNAFKPYEQFGFRFRFPEKPKEKKIRKMTIMGIGSKPITHNTVSQPISEIPEDSSIGDFFYQRVRELGIDEFLLRYILQDGYTFVVGRIVLESIFCQKFDATLPIVLFTCKGDDILPQLKKKYFFTCVHGENGAWYAFFKSGDKPIFKVYCFRDVAEMHNAVDHPTKLQFTRNFFDGKHFVMKDYDAVIGMHHTDYYYEDNNSQCHDDYTTYYKKFGFTFHIEQKPKVEMVKKQTILCASAKPLQPRIPESVTSFSEVETKSECMPSSSEVGTSTSMPSSSNAEGNCQEFFYKRLEELGVDSNRLRAYLNNGAGNTYVTGLIVLEAIYGKRLGANLPIDVYTTDENVFGELLRIFPGFNNILQVTLVDNLKVLREKIEERYKLSFCRNHFNGGWFTMYDCNAVAKKRHTVSKQEYDKEFENFGYYMQYGFTLHINDGYQPSFMLGTKPAGSPHIPFGASEFSAASLRGVKYDTPLNKVDYERKTVGNRFDDLCKTHGILNLVKKVTELHKNTSHKLLFFGNVVHEAVVGEKGTDNPFTLILSTMPHESISKLVEEEGFKFNSHGGLCARGNSDMRIYIDTQKMTTYESIRKERHISNSRCEYDGEKFYIADFSNFITGFVKKFPGIETNDVCVDDKNIVTFSSRDFPLTYKPATMKDYIERHIQSLGEDADTITELMGLPDTVMVGHPVLSAFRGDSRRYEDTHLICYDFFTVFMIMGRRGYSPPNFVDLTVKPYQYKRAYFKCLNGKGTISIRIPENNNKEFTAAYTLITAMGGLNYDKEKFTKYRVCLDKERTVTKEEFDCASLPIQ